MITCCKDCVAPKRRPGCHGSCPEYIVEKAEHDRERLERAMINNIHRREMARTRTISCEIKRRNLYKD